MILPLYALLLTPLVNAWTFGYTNATDATEIARGGEAQDCTTSPIGKEKPFTWDPEGSDLCVSIYRDTKCASRAGYSCGVWRKNASESFAAFDVLLEKEIDAKDQTATLALTSTSTSATSTSTSSSSSVSSTSASATTTPTKSGLSAGNDNTGSSSNPSLSGGAIAGVVVGVVAAVAIIVALAVIFMRKRNRKNAPVASQHGGYGPHEADATGSSISGTTAVTEKGTDSVARPFRPPPGSHVVELAGDEGSAELGNSPISEMDGNSTKRDFNRV
ncbi:hypothetical protein N7516_007034 [Penicillium verrucosum]|uniref:uncharacterized protein n=1 Tax=Penicillium verrucosum TaxID=60171 RepID=UPI0025451FFE|nr:uncharacterized protein N7516_007034 [Penicillium verrucosum]KAJ5932545.1 hypothetical protein N7516_007034 [Penicillium verrucosum]